jgi:hypothetical protein
MDTAVFPTAVGPTMAIRVLVIVSKDRDSFYNSGVPADAQAVGLSAASPRKLRAFRFYPSRKKACFSILGLF